MQRLGTFGHKKRTFLLTATELAGPGFSRLNVQYFPQIFFLDGSKILGIIKYVGRRMANQASKLLSISNLCLQF
jgi:hypothetical protein